MSAPNKQLLTLLAQIQRKLRLQLFLHWLRQCWLLGSAAALMFLLLAHVFPITLHRLEVVGGLLLLAVLCAGGVTLWNAPSIRHAAVFADTHGLLQRIGTALDHADNPAEIARLQREDAYEQLRQSMPQLLDQISLRVRSKRAVTLLVASAPLLIALLLFPNQHDAQLRLAAAQAQELAQLSEKLEQAKEELKKQPEVEEAKRKQLTDLYSQLQAELQANKNPQDAQKALEKTALLLKKMEAKEQVAAQAQQMLTRQLAQHSQTKALADALQREPANAAQALEQWKKQMESLPAEVKQQVQEQLNAAIKEAAQQVKAIKAEEAQALAQEWQMTAQAMEHMQSNEAMAKATQLLQQTTQAQTASQALAANMAQVNGLMQSTQMALAQGALPAAGMNGQPANAGAIPNSANMANRANPTTATPNNANANGNMTSQPPATTGAAGGNTSANAGTGTGTGNPGGQGAGGQGNGSGNGKGGIGSGGKGSGAGLGNGSHELIAVPAARVNGTGGPKETVGGPLGAGGGDLVDSTESQVTSGSVRPYAEVYQQYEQMSRQSLERSSIPADYQQIVRDYFADIEPK